MVEPTPSEPSSAREQGHILLLALFVLLIMTIAVALAAAANQRRLITLRTEASRLHLQALDDAAIAATLAELELGQSRGLTPRPLAGGEVGSRVEGSGRRVVIETCARLGGRHRSSAVDVLLGGAHPRVVGWRPNAGPTDPWCD